MKQTAVEWLQQVLEDTILTHEQIMQTIGLFEQAKDTSTELSLPIPVADATNSTLEPFLVVY